MINEIDTHLRLEIKKKEGNQQHTMKAAEQLVLHSGRGFLKKSKNVLRHCYRALIELTSALDLGFCVNRM